MTRETAQTESPIVTTLVDWFDRNERDLPWRRSTPWGVLVSEYMLQQTPVERVLPVWREWLTRWPEPQALAAASVADALRAWGRLGYPRRAARLHATAVRIGAEHAGEVPRETEALRALPGVGEYTAAAIRAFAFGLHSIVLDTNVRRVLARTQDGQARQTDHITSGERSRTAALWPTDASRSARWSAAVMEFGAVVCTARAPSCGSCAVRSGCAWHQADQPRAPESRRPRPAYAGSDREARGALLQALRSTTRSMSARRLADAWPEAEQRARALAGLVEDGLVMRGPDARYTLPGDDQPVADSLGSGARSDVRITVRSPSG